MQSELERATARGDHAREPRQRGFGPRRGVEVQIRDIREYLPGSRPDAHDGGHDAWKHY